MCDGGTDGTRRKCNRIALVLQTSEEVAEHAPVRPSPPTMHWAWQHDISSHAYPRYQQASPLARPRLSLVRWHKGVAFSARSQRLGPRRTVGHPDCAAEITRRVQPASANLTLICLLHDPPFDPATAVLRWRCAQARALAGGKRPRALWIYGQARQTPWAYGLTTRTCVASSSAH